MKTFDWKVPKYDTQAIPEMVLQVLDNRPKLEAVRTLIVCVSNERDRCLDGTSYVIPIVVNGDFQVGYCFDHLSPLGVPRLLAVR